MSPELGHFERSNDDAYIEQAIREAEQEQRIVNDTTARMIASQHHGGQWSAMYSFSSCGAISLDALRDELAMSYAEHVTDEPERTKLDHLILYLLEHGDRGPVDGWSRLWGDPSP